MIAGSLEIQLLANMARLQKDMDGARRSVSTAMASIEKSVGQAKAALGGLVAGLSVGEIVGKLVDVQRQFDVLNASLVTATGSSANASIAFKALEEFAATTPFGLAEVTEAFIKMRNLGLDPSEAALTSYGNTAAAMGKSLNQFIEAVADASTSEFERLKEFGIKASQEGDKVSLTFQGVTKTIGNNATEIQRYLKAIGDSEFAGAMEERAKTLDGAISNLADTWDALFRTVSSQGTGNIIYDSVILATGAIQDLITILKALDSGLDSGAEKAKQFGVFQEAIATIFETVTVLGVNVAYVLRGIGTELGGLAAQAASVAKLDFAGAKAIGEMMKSDAAAARVQVDADTARILNARKVAAAAPKSAGGDRLAQFAIKNTPTPAAPKKTGKSDAEKAAEEAAKFIAKLKEEAVQVGMSADQIKMMAAAREAAKAPTAGLRLEIMQSALALDSVTKAHEAKTEAERIAAANEAQSVAAAQQQIASAFDAVDALQLEIETYDMLPAAITRAEIAKLEMHKATLEANQGTAEEIRVTEALILAKNRLAGLQDAKTELDKQKENVAELKKIQDNFVENVQRNLGSGLFDMMNGGFKGIGDSFKKMLLQMVADAAAANITAALFGNPKQNGSTGILSGALTAGLGFLGIAGAKADGGHVNGGSTYLVGERGPELFKSSSSGTIVPNHAMQGGASPSVTVQNTYNIDSRTDQSTIVQMLERNKAQTKADIQREMQRSRNAYSRA